jgi:endonuclease/exonuclease/phosphatase family metal-dependent hydrolase
MAVKTPDTREEQDSAYNPGDIHAAEQFAGDSYTSAGIDQLEAFANDETNASTRTKEAEENPAQTENNINYTGNGQSSQPQKQRLTGRLTGRLKRNSALTAIVGALLTAMFGLSLLSPGLLLVQLKETLTDKFNDQLAAMDVRQTAIMKKKLGKTTTTGICGENVSIRCKYRTIGDRHDKRLEAAGFTIEGDKDIFGRTKPTSFTLNGGEPISADQMLGEATSDANLRSALRHGYNPRFAAFSDAIANKVNSSLGIKKARNINPSADEEAMREQLKESASGEAGTQGGRPRSETVDGETKYYDGDGNPVIKEEFDRINSAIDELDARNNLVDGVKKTALKSGLKSSVTSFAVGLGTVDTFCTAWTTIRVASQAAKIYGARQIIRYSHVFMNTADDIKRGTATPESVAYLGKILTSVNSKGKSATDSAGYHYATDGDIFKAGKFDASLDGKALTDSAVDNNILQNEVSRYVNGQIIPDNMVASLISKIGASDSKTADKTCEVVKSWKGQAIIFTAAIGGAVLAFFTGGASLGAGTVAQIAATATLSIALAIIVPKLMDMAKGELITGEENGNEAGNAITSGRAGYNAQVSQARALAVLDQDDAVEYNQATQRTVADYNETERLELSPFDPTSKNTFIGGIVSSLIPYATKLAQPGSTLTSTASLVTQSFGNIINPTTNAATVTKEEFEQCDDIDYKGLAADPFCNLRYGLSKEALAIDPEGVLNYMETNGYIEQDSTNGKPGGVNGSVYQEYITQCIERTTAIGDTLTEDEQGNGENCIQGKSGGNEERNTMFRLFYLDTSIQDGMDSDFSVGTASAVNSGAGGQFNVGSFNICYGVAAGGGYPSCARGVGFEERLQNTVKTIKDNDIQVVGLQEVRENQWNALQNTNALGGTYDIFPKPYGRGAYPGQNPVIWKTSEFELIKDGSKAIDGYSVTSGPNATAYTQVKLRYISTGQTFYLINVHEPVGTGSAIATARKKSAELLASKVKDLSGEGIPIFITGDFNSKYQACGAGVVQTALDCKRENMPYCILTNNTGLWDSWDAFNKKTGTCPSQDYNGGPGPVDHIYLSSGVEVSKYKYFGGGVRSNGSDHSTLMVGVTIPGGEESAGGSSGPVSSEGWTWPMKPEFSKAGPCWGGPRTHAGMDINTNEVNADVYAMHEGKVVKVIDGTTGSSPATGNHVMIETSGGFFYGYQHLQPGKMKVKEGDSVIAGQVIGVAGKTGSVEIESSKAHLHITIARTNTTGSYGNLSTTLDPMSVLKDVKPNVYNCYVG